MSFAAGSLVRARGREWVVLPESSESMLILRPLGGTDEEVTGVHLALEQVTPATFEPPDPQQSGDSHSGRLLRDAVRIGFRSSVGPFRSFAHIAVEPRPYQLVPLLMALRLDPVRLLIADDVGIGKTIEAGLIARELLDRREVDRLAVLCPPHLAEQWQTELREKFHIEAVVVLSSTVAQLERACAHNQSLFERYKHVIISIDFIKADRRREDFVHACPELVIIDEAHTCAFSGQGGVTRHQRYQLISRLANDPTRHLILVTATPHSGNEQTFRSLLTLLNPEFGDLPEDLSGRHNERHRQRLAAHFVQRRRGDITHYMQQETPFPQREDTEWHYKLTAEYRRLMERVLEYARETVRDANDGHHRQRIRWWSALALLRAIASSPAAAAQTLRNRAQVADFEQIEEIDAIGLRTVLDLAESESGESIDVVPGSDFEDEQSEEKRHRRRLLEMAREAEVLEGAKDAKLQKILPQIANLVKQGYQPIVFCRFIPTAEYVTKSLRQYLPNNVEVSAITGLLPPAEREMRVYQLAQSPQRVLVCTDCLSEGINLQGYFNAVVHYDLSWNPTRHEQREGRVDRYGQASPNVKVITYFGEDNHIDGLVLKVLIRKHRQIRSSLGISVPVPLDTEQVIQAIFEGVLLSKGGKSAPSTSQLLLPGIEDVVYPQRQKLDQQWDVAAERERKSRTIFAQHSIKTEEVEQELNAVRSAMGWSADIKRFVTEALVAHGAFATNSQRYPDMVEYRLLDIPHALRDTLNLSRFVTNKDLTLRASFTRTGLPETLYLNRTHPLVAGLAAYVMDTALDDQHDTMRKAVARRCGVIRTSAVQTRTTLLLIRLRFHIYTPGRAGMPSTPLLAEECRMLAFNGAPDQAQWIVDEQEVLPLLDIEPTANLNREFITRTLTQLLADMPPYINPYLEQYAHERAEALRDAHRRVRRAASLGVRNLTVEPQLPPDILGVYHYIPQLKLSL